jgi:hypothetical protein
MGRELPVTRGIPAFARRPEPSFSEPVLFSLPVAESMPGACHDREMIAADNRKFPDGKRKKPESKWQQNCRNISTFSDEADMVMNRSAAN